VHQGWHREVFSMLHLYKNVHCNLEEKKWNSGGTVVSGVDVHSEILVAAEDHAPPKAKAKL